MSTELDEVLTIYTKFLRQCLHLSWRIADCGIPADKNDRMRTCYGNTRSNKLDAGANVPLQLTSDVCSLHTVRNKRAFRVMSEILTVTSFDLFTHYTKVSDTTDDQSALVYSEVAAARLIIKFRAANIS